MHERMLDKQIIPTEAEIHKFIGTKSVRFIETIKKSLEKIFELDMKLRFPYGKEYGWSYKVSNKSKHLFDLFFEKGSISIMLQLSKIQTENEIEKYNKLSDEGKVYWENRYPCGKNGGWIDYRILNKWQLKDIGIFLSIKINKEIVL
jgi:hypothetical protein